ncbi:hypothetical protein CN271_32740 [Bacillus cereus]|uniref:hypothetical protein n=1 Tax=Bacillus cereus TaxID=1396 RepID=UPI000BEB2CBD|nr:hypothetical protein [Bacillus cereus]PEE32375.1 hypothetical protein CON59_31480 [Bacillus cereus]PET26767.1 hypothetical protein CN523_32725 [Bacillus cereus]PEV70511.1 hypothetical protein CN429_30830 [Bacillus cereus]PFA56988.1 hypothetical protein CN389_10605 [Bacillus cereus]PFD50569.1 hypothetical protein CN271_32740 [Bacillus cereus]
MNQHKEMYHTPYQDRSKSNCHNRNHPSNSEGPYTEQGPTIFRSNYLLDARDNPVIALKEYHLVGLYEGRITPMGVASSWGANWLYTDDTTLIERSLKVKLSQYNFSSNYSIKLGEMTWIQISSPDYNPQYSYLGPNVTWGGVQLGARGGEYNNEEWYPQVHTRRPDTHYSSFGYKNAYTNKYLRNLGPDKWAEADGAIGNQDTEFVLIPVES